MVDLLEIQGVNKDRVQLLDAVGVETSSALSQSDPGSLLEEIEHANSRLELVEELPTLDQLIAWIEEARSRSGELEGVDITRLDEVVELVPIEALKAFPVSRENIIKNEIAVGDVPVMDDFLDERELFVEEVRKIDSEPSAITATVREIAPKRPARTKTSREEVESSDPNSPRPKVEPLKRNAGFDIRKTAIPETNVGKTLHSRRYVRGVLHPQPTRVKIGGFLSLVTIVLLPLSFVAGGAILFFKDQKTIVYACATVPASLIIFGLLYLMFAHSLKCRVCGIPLYRPKSCRRNPKAHHIPLLGYILPTCVHLLLFKWFRCIHCGTSVRLKE